MLTAASVLLLASLYKDLHSHPELSFQEKQTSVRLAKELGDAGLKVTTGVGGYGVVAVLENGQGSRLLVRTDMDALPVEEKTGVGYASRTPGVMHACGHDVHMTALVGTARELVAHRDAWSGTVVFIGEPAEERGGGAKAMLEDGLYRRFGKPDAALALHVDSALEVGKVSYRAGFAMASADSVDITMRGKGGHGALPQTTIDPIVLASQLVLDLQTLVSRESDPVEPAVVTVGSFHCGTKHNIVSDHCDLQVSVRAASAANRERLLEGIRRKAFAIAAGARAPEPVVKNGVDYTPVLTNDPKLVARVVPFLKKAVGETNVEQSDPAMTSEDFSRFSQDGVPVFMFRVGSVPKSRLSTHGGASLHSGGYFPEPEKTIETGVTAMTAAVEGFLGTHRL